MPVSAAYRPDPRHPSLGDEFFDVVAAAEFPQQTIRFRNDRAAASVGLETLTDEEWIAHFARFEPLPGNIPQPLALRYHGHQFRHYNPDIGDGRGFLFAQMREAGTDRLLDLSTKGSGRTPWSRSGDGRLTLKGGVREVLATEMLEALGVLTSRSFSLIETGEALQRGDEPSPTRSSVLTRLSYSHLRIGAFQRLAVLGQMDELKRLIDFAIETYFPDAAAAPDPVLALFEKTLAEVARLGGEWTAAGFVHGVLNSDNIVITGESFDYGPWRFMPTYDPAFTAAYFDAGSLYAFGRQFEALAWNLARYAECLARFTPVEPLQATLDRFFDLAVADAAAATHRRLHLSADDGEADRRSTLFWTAMRATGPPFERVFFDLMGGADEERIARSPIRETYEDPAWKEAIAALRAARPTTPTADLFGSAYASRSEPVSMLIDEVEAIWAPIDERDDWSAFESKIAEIRAAARWLSAERP